MEDDDRFFVVNGRRWRRTDPAIPENLRTELVAELMDARRAVKVKEPDARARVGDAKVALGERGVPWWESPDDDGRRARIEAAMRALLRRRDGGSVCPSEVARVVDGADWRRHLALVREVASDLDGVLLLQKGEPAPPDARGPVRIGRTGP